jgi:ribosomal protein L14E/L6E/L27E
LGTRLVVVLEPVDGAEVVVVEPPVPAEVALEDRNIAKVAPTKRTRITRTTISEGW